MERAEITLEFEDVKTRLAVGEALEKAPEDAAERFTIVPQARTVNMDSQLLELLVMFMENGGLVALAAFLNLLRDILKRLFPEKQVVVTRGKKKASVSAESSDNDLKKIAVDLDSP